MRAHRQVGFDAITQPLRSRGIEVEGRILVEEIRGRAERVDFPVAAIDEPADARMFATRQDEIARRFDVLGVHAGTAVAARAVVHRVHDDVDASLERVAPDDIVEHARAREIECAIDELLAIRDSEARLAPDREHEIAVRRVEQRAHQRRTEGRRRSSDEHPHRNTPRRSASVASISCSTAARASLASTPTIARSRAASASCAGTSGAP